MKNSADRGGCYPPRSKAKVDNTLRDLQNSSYPTKAEFNNCFIIKFSTSDNAFLAVWLLHSISVISSYTLVWPYMENKKISFEQRGEKSRFCELSTYETTRKKRKCHTGSDKKATNFGSKLFNGTPKFPYKFKEIISLFFRTSSWLCNKNNTKNFTLKVFRMAAKSLQV